LENIYIDSGILIKIFDVYNYRNTLLQHSEVKKKYSSLIQRFDFISTNITISEALNHITNLLFKRNNPYNIKDLIEFCSNCIENDLRVDIISDDYYHKRAVEIIKENQAYKYNYVDAISLAYIENIGGCIVFTLDENWQNFTFLKGYEYCQLEIVNLK